MVNGTDNVQMINPTAVGGEFWFLSPEPKADPRFNSGELTGNYTDGFKVTTDPAFMTVENSIGYSPGSVRNNVNHAFIASTGFLYSSKDWRDVEMTGYFDCREVLNPNARIQMFARSAEIPSSRQWCPGSFYMGELAMDGRFRWVKSQYWLSAFQQDWISANEVGLGSDLTQRINGWFGIKIIIHNVDIGDGQLGVQLQLYVDRNNSNGWTLIGTSELIDRGGWGEDGTPCGGKKDQIITWGGPLATFKIEGDTAIIFNKLSVREIDAGGHFPLPAPTEQTSLAQAGAFTRVIGMVTFRYRVGVSVIPTCVGEIPTDPDPPAPGPGDPEEPPPGNVFVEMSLAHKYNINRQQTVLTIIEEFTSEVVAISG
jgi:hypothetical protein